MTAAGCAAAAPAAGALAATALAATALVAAVLAAAVLLASTAAPAAAAGLGDYTSHAVTENGLVVVAGADTLVFAVVAPDIVHLDFRPAGAGIRRASFAAIHAPDPGIAFAVTDLPDRLGLAAGGLVADIAKRPVRVTWRDPGGQVLLGEPAGGGLDASGGWRTARFALPPGLSLYGSGSRGLGPDLRGTSFGTWNTQAYGYSGPLATMNLNVPFYATSGGAALLFDSPLPARVDLGAQNSGAMSYGIEDGELAYYLIAARGVPDQLDRYTWLTGRQPLPPRWALGFLQSKFGYRDRAAAEAMARTMREKRIPADGIVLDLYWFEHMGDLAWHEAAFPDPAGMLAGFREQGFKTLVISEPYFVERCRHYAHLTGPGSSLVAQDPGGGPYVLPGWWSCDCDAVLLDVTLPQARAWLQDRTAEYLAAGVDGLWTDLGEPERHPADMRHALGSAVEVHNVFNLLWSQAMFEGFAALRPDARLVNLTRSGHAGSQRYGVFTWSGDVARTFGGLATQPTLMLNAGLSGLAYHSSDLGGFVGTATAELYVRWLQFGAFNPVMRTHGVDTQPTEPWAHGPQAEAIVRRYIELRYQLLPYLYTLARENHDTGLPLARPLFFADPSAALVDVGDAFLCGPDLLVAPVLQAGQREREVDLPAGTWVHYWSGEEHAGGRTISVPAPLDELPLFVRAGAILPMQPVTQFVDAAAADTLLLDVYPAAAGGAGAFTLYEDDGVSLGYQRGEFARIGLAQRTLAAGRAGGRADGRRVQVTLAAADGRYPGMPLVRTVLVTVNLMPASPDTVRLGLEPVARYPDRSALLAAAGAGYIHDPGTDEVLVKFTHDVDVATLVEVFTTEGGGGDGDGGGNDGDHPGRPHLGSIQPSPMTDSTTVVVRVPAPGGPVRLEVYDLAGAAVRVLADTALDPGEHAFVWDGAAADGRRAPSGVYVVRMTAAGETQSRKLTLLR